MSQGKRIFQRFLLIYLLFALCMLLLLIPLYATSWREAKTRTLATVEETLHAGIATFENALDSATEVADKLYSHADIRMLRFLKLPIMAEDAVVVRDAQTLYYAMTKALPFAEDAGLYLSNGGLLFTPNNGFQSSTAFYFPNAQDIFNPYASANYLFEADNVPGLSFEQLLSELNILGNTASLTQLNWGRANKELRDTVFYAFSLPLNTPAKSNIFFVTYDAQTLLELLVLPQYHDACTLTLTRMGENKISLAQRAQQDAFQITYHSPSHNFDVSLALDRSVIYGQLRPFRTTMLLSLIIYILAGLVLSMLFSRRNARPMVKLVAAAEQAGRQSDISLNLSAQSLNSYQYVHSLIDGMSYELTAAHQKQEWQAMQLKDSMIERLLRGDLHHENALNQARSFFPDFPPCLCMILVRLLHTHEMALEDFTAAQFKLSELFKTYLPADVRIYVFSNLTVLLCPCDEESYQETCAAIISNLSPYMDMDELNVRFAVSTPLHGLESLSSAFQHLRHLLHVLGDTGDGVVFAKDETESIAQEYSYSTTSFYEMLLRGEHDIALALMNEDVLQLRRRGATNDTEVQQLFFIYRHELMRVQEELRRIMAASQTFPALPSYLPQLSVEEQFDRLRACCGVICECIGERRLSERESLAGRMLSYIDSRLSDPTLCVRAVIDQFNISESTLRNLLFKAVGVNFSEYVESHRMKYAKQLVQHGSIAVSQIPQQCGYASANTFYKAFKRYYGLSPSQMRDQLPDGEADGKT